MSESIDARVQTLPIEESDAIVVGGNLAGLAIAYLLGSWGYRVRVIEPAPAIGGIDRSFRNANDRIFDVGLHALDHLRSEFTTRLFRSVVDDEVNLMERRRGIVLRSHVIPYNAPLEQWPDELRALFPSQDLVDELGEAHPTRENLARYYGEAFTDLIFDETLASYPSEQHHLAYGVEPWELMVNIYPWFFPSARRTDGPRDQSRIYHDEKRERRREDLLYPRQGGFGTFVEGFANRIEGLGGEIVAGAKDFHTQLDSAGRRVEWLLAAGRRFTSPRIYWCAPPHTLADLLDKPVPELRPDMFVLGSFEFDRPIQCDFTEVLAGDPEHLINRISFPGKLARVRDDLVQIEFAYPRQSNQYEDKASFWLERWVPSLQRLGIVAPGSRVVDFDYKSSPMVYNSFGVDGLPMPEVDFSGDLPADSNLRPVLPTIRKVNINHRIPLYLEFLAADVLGRR